MKNSSWSAWARFPDPKAGGILVAPIGPGCYEIRHCDRPIMFGMSGNVAARLSSLLPKPLGTGTRRNLDKCNYCLKHLGDVEYRTIALPSRADALAFERELRRNRARYLFRT